MLHLNFNKKDKIRDKEISHMKFIIHRDHEKGKKVRATDRFSRQKFALVVQCLYIFYLLVNRFILPRKY